MLAIFIHKSLLHKLQLVACGIAIIFCQNLFSQKSSILENITESDGLPSNYVFNVCEDQNQILWFGTDKGLVAYQDGEWISLDADNGMPGNYITQMIADGKNGLLLNIAEKGLYYFNSNNRKIIARYPETNGNLLNKIKISNKNKDYIILQIHNPHLNETSYFAFDKNNVKNLTKLNVEGNNLIIKKNGKEEIISDFTYLQKPEEITFEKYTLKPSSNGVVRLLNGKIFDTIKDTEIIGNYPINHILKRTNDDIIFSTHGGGISILKKTNSKISFNNKNINVREFFYQNGKNYILSDGSIYVISKDKIEAKKFIAKDALTFYIEGNNAYVGTFSGLQFYKISQNDFILQKTIPITSGISKILKIKDKIIFSTYGNGLQILENNSLRKINNKPFNSIENLFKIDNGYVLASYESGITVLNENFEFKNHFSKKNGLISNYATCIFSEKDTLYVGTKKGVTVFLRNKPIAFYNELNGYNGQVTKAIFKDNKNKLWILTDKFLLRKEKNSLKPLGSLRLTDNASDKILKGNFSRENNLLFFANKNKFVEVDMSKIVPNETIHTTILEKVLENGESVNFNQEINFPDHNKNIYFIFKSVDKDLLTKSKLFYRINGDAWKPFKQPISIKFPHLDQGKYTLEVKTINEDGYEKLMTEPIKFKVLSPFYIRWWFILLSLLVVGLFLYSYLNEMNKKKYVKRLNQLRVKHELENERKRISRDLHDNIGAYVTSLISKIDKLKNTPKDHFSEGSCADVRLDAENILALLRQTIWVLGNKETNIIALYDNFKSYALKFLQTDNTRIIFEENIKNNRKIDPASGSEIFRILQEALQNIHKHAQATRVEVNVISNDKMILYIKDNGKGFNSKELKEGFGLRNMRERAREIGFKLNIYSDDTGTTLELYEI